MRKLALIGTLLLFFPTSWAQTAPALKPAPKPAVPATTAAGPTAIIQTTAGNLTCTLFPKASAYRRGQFHWLGARH